MNIQIQPNYWTCLPTAAAIVLDIPLKQLLEDIGHDGSQIIFPQFPEPKNRQSFHIQEIIYVCYSKYKKHVVQFDKFPESCVQSGKICEKCSQEIMGPSFNLIKEDQFFDILIQNNGILVGKSIFGYPHAVAWNGSKVYDPSGEIYNYERFNTESFYAVI